MPRPKLVFAAVALSALAIAGCGNDDPGTTEADRHHTLDRVIEDGGGEAPIGVDRYQLASEICDRFDQGDTRNNILASLIDRYNMPLMVGGPFIEQAIVAYCPDLVRSPVK